MRKIVEQVSWDVKIGIQLVENENETFDFEFFIDAMDGLNGDQVQYVWSADLLTTNRQEARQISRYSLDFMKTVIFEWVYNRGQRGGEHKLRDKSNSIPLKLVLRKISGNDTYTQSIKNSSPDLDDYKGWPY